MINEENCLFYKQGDRESAVLAIERICKDKNLQIKLSKNGRETAESREWKKIEQDILKLYVR